jgi:DnaK suppressor protein
MLKTYCCVYSDYRAVISKTEKRRRKKMNLETVKQNLLDKQAEITSRVDRTHKHIHHKEEPVSADFSEQVTEMENEEIIHALDEEGRAELRQIQHALQRLEQGQYEICASCGENINQQRLEAIPETDQCINCASKN